jgi:hypothetical protein
VEKARKELAKLKAEDKATEFRPVLANMELKKLTPPQRRELHSLRSHNAYIKRKREQHAEMVRA